MELTQARNASSLNFEEGSHGSILPEVPRGGTGRSSTISLLLHGCCHPVARRCELEEYHTGFVFSYLYKHIKARLPSRRDPYPTPNDIKGKVFLGSPARPLDLSRRQALHRP